MNDRVYRNILKIIGSTLCVIIAILLTSATASAMSIVTEVENNDTMGSANYINVQEDSTIKGNFSSEEDVDFYTFTVQRGGLLSINVKYYGEKPAKYYGNYDLLTYYIYSADDYSNYISYRIAEYEENLGYASANEKHYISAGTYYLKFVGIGTYDYEISVDAMDEYEDFAEPNNYIGQAVELQDGETIHGVMAENREEMEDPDFFKITADEDGIYEITLKNYGIGGDSDRGNCLGMFAYDASGNSMNLFYSKNRGYRSWCYVEDSNTQRTERVSLNKGNTYIKVGTLGQWGYYEISYKKVQGQSDLIKESIANTKITSLKANTNVKKKVKLTWSPSQSTYKASGYVVYRSAKKTSGYKIIYTTTKKKCTDASVKSGRTYWYKVRCYKVMDDGSKVYGKWSRIKAKVK